MADFDIDWQDSNGNGNSNGNSNSNVSTKFIPSVGFLHLMQALSGLRSTRDVQLLSALIP